MSESLDAECTPLKKGYDSCMNKWLEEYLQTVADHKTKPNSAAVKAKGQELQTRCGSVFARYRSCVQRALDERGVSQLLQEAREEDPLSVPPPFDTKR